MFKTSFLAACLVSALPLAALAQDAGTVVATVDGTPITLGQMIAMKQGLHDQAAANLPDQALWDLMLDQMIRQTAVAKSGEAAMTPGDEARLEIERRAYLSSRALERVAEVEPTEEEIAATFAKAFGGAEATTEYSAAHILVKTEDEAKAIKAELDGGADFTKLAQEKSTDVASAPGGGALGWFAAEQMVAPFAETVKGMEKGKVSDPVETQFGWHVIRLDDTRIKQPPKLDEVRTQVANQVRRDKVEAEILRLVGAAKVEKTEGLDPSLLNQTDLLDAQ